MEAINNNEEQESEKKQGIPWFILLIDLLVALHLYSLTSLLLDPKQEKSIDILVYINAAAWVAFLLLSLSRWRHFVKVGSVLVIISFLLHSPSILTTTYSLSLKPKTQESELVAMTLSYSITYNLLDEMIKPEPIEQLRAISEAYKDGEDIPFSNIDWSGSSVANTNISFSFTPFFLLIPLIFLTSSTRVEKRYKYALIET